MADIYDQLDSIAEEFAEKVALAQEEIVSSLMQFIKDKEPEEALEILAGFNMEASYDVKLRGAFGLYETGIISLLENTLSTDTLSEKTLQTLLNNTKGMISDEVTKHLSKVSLQSIIDGVAVGKSPAQVIKTIDEAMPNIETLVNTAYNQFGNSVTELMALKAPKNTRYVYIGANDEKTRLTCLDKIAFSGSRGRTRGEILAQFGDMRNELWNCRHKWEKMSDSPKDQGYEFKKRIRLNA